MKVAIVDYGVGNLGSVVKALDQVGAQAALVSDPAQLRDYGALLLPGVGNFGDCAGRLEQGGWKTALREEVRERGRPLLGICVGMQLLADSSSEGEDAQGAGSEGLGLVPGRVRSLRELGCALRVPHVGWNSLRRAGPDDPLLAHIPDGTDFYFVHSYAFEPSDLADLVATVDYGIDVAAAVRHGRVWGTQFHPEKSSRAGSRLLANFLREAAC
jgi:glutamine amidotransferase